MEKRNAVAGITKGGKENRRANRASENPIDNPTTAIRRLYATDAIATYRQSNR